MGQLFHGVPCENFPHGQNQCPEGKNFKLPSNFIRVYPEVWERLQDYIQACPYHRMENWLVLQNFYEGLTPMSKGHVDAAAGGAFLSLTINNAIALIKKMVANQSWGEERKQQKGMHTVKETDMLAAKNGFVTKEA